MTSEEFKTKETETFNNYKVPQSLRSWLSYQAYERGHSSGMEEVLNCLIDMLDGFPEAWKSFIKEVKTKPPEKTSADAPPEYSNEEATCYSHGYADGRRDVLNAIQS